MLKNTYDKQQRVTEQKWDNASAFRFTYDDFGQLQSHSDLLNNVVYEYRYDLLHRLAGMRATNGQEIRVAYDAKNRVSAVTQKVGSESVKTAYLYGDVSKGERPGLFYGLQVAGSTRASYTYDSLARMTGKTLKLDGKDYAIRYTYLPGTGAGVTTMLINSISSGGKTLTYTYDVVGNITAIAENGTNKAKYTYDALSRLTRADSVWENKSVVYAYDAGGNLTSRKEYAYTTGTLGTVQKTVSYGYRTSGWKDQMTSYNGQTITYDNGGNPLTWRGMTLTWKYGRRLATLKKGTATAAYAYDNEGHRVSRTDLDGTTYTYYWNGDQVMAMKKGNTLVHFVYDQAGNLFAMRTGGKYYYYLHNLQNDVTGLLDSSGNQVVSYVYDSWGKPVSMTDTSGNDVGSLNPFRYREYCWDEDTGLYYVSSRYYDPEVGRFISPDTTDVLTATPMALIDKNLYAYCDNNPVMREDKDGQFWNIIAGALIGGGLELAGQLLAVKSLSDINWAKVGVSALSGGLTAAVGPVAGCLISGATDVAMDAVDSKINSFEDVVKSFVWGTAKATVSYGVSTAVGNVTKSLTKVEKVGRIGEGGYPGVKYSYNKGRNGNRAIRSIELHSRHNGHGIHLQGNKWNPKTGTRSGVFFRRTLWR